MQYDRDNPSGNTTDELCLETALQSTLESISGKWRMRIICRLLQGTQRFSEIQRPLSGLTRHVLTLDLRQLERAGIVTRTVYPSIPPRVEYTLTARGYSLKKVFLAMEEWGLNPDTARCVRNDLPLNQ